MLIILHSVNVECRRKEVSLRLSVITCWKYIYISFYRSNPLLTPGSVGVEDVAEPADALFALPLLRHVHLPGLDPPEQIPQRGLLLDPRGGEHPLPDEPRGAGVQNL